MPIVVVIAVLILLAITGILPVILIWAGGILASLLEVIPAILTVLVLFVLAKAIFGKKKSPGKAAVRRPPVKKKPLQLSKDALNAPPDVPETPAIPSVADVPSVDEKQPTAEEKKRVRRYALHWLWISTVLFLLIALLSVWFSGLILMVIPWLMSLLATAIIFEGMPSSQRGARVMFFLSGLISIFIILVALSPKNNEVKRKIQSPPTPSVQEKKEPPAPKVQAEPVAPKPKATPKPKEENPYEGESCDPSLYYGRACRVACFDDPHCVISSRELPGHPCYCHKKIGVPNSW